MINIYLLHQGPEKVLNLSELILQDMTIFTSDIIDTYLPGNIEWFIMFIFCTYNRFHLWLSTESDFLIMLLNIDETLCFMMAMIYDFSVC